VRVQFFKKNPPRKVASAEWNVFQKDPHWRGGGKERSAERVTLSECGWCVKGRAGTGGRQDGARIQAEECGGGGRDSCTGGRVTVRNQGFQEAEQEEALRAGEK